MGAGIKKGMANQLGEYTRKVKLRADMTTEQNEKGKKSEDCHIKMNQKLKMTQYSTYKRRETNVTSLKS